MDVRSFMRWFRRLFKKIPIFFRKLTKTTTLQDLIFEIPATHGKNIFVVGSGYVGLPLAILRAFPGAKVSVVDTEPSIIAKLQKGIPPFYEEGVPELLADAIATGRINFHTDLDPLVKDADVIYSCVGTPSSKDPAKKGSADISAIFSVAKQIGQNMVKGQKLLVVQTSTAPPGTTREMYETILANLPYGMTVDDVDLAVVFRAEYLKQGYAFEDNLVYDRKGAAVYPEKEWAKILFEHVDHTYKKAPFVWLSNLVTAEMTKYANNGFLATKISFINSQSQLADKLGANITEVAEMMGMDLRIEFWGLLAGLGYGGGCFPKDVKALAFIMKEHGIDPKILDAVMDANELQVETFAQKIFVHFGGETENVVIACGGITFKPDTDFVDPSQSLSVVKLLLKHGFKVRVYDPVGLDKFRNLEVAENPNLEIAENIPKLLEGADAFALLTEWPELRNLTVVDLQTLESPVVFDGRNAMDMEKLKAAGFTYQGVGRS